jgi:hypothetical protein
MTDVQPAAPPPRRHLVVGTPCYGGMVTHLYMTSIMNLQKECLIRGIPFQLALLGGDALITRARNTIATQFMENTEATHLLFIDADIGFDAKSVFRLLDFNVDFCGGMYPVKNIEWSFAKECVEQGRDIRSGTMNYVVGFEDRTKIEGVGPFAKAKYLGNGFMLLTRKVFETLEEKYPELKFRRINANPDPQADSPHRYAFFECMIDERGFYLPEDYTFCKRWSDAGGDIWVDLESKLTHLGLYNFVGDTTDLFSSKPAP